MIRQQRFRVLLVVGLTCVSAVYGRAQPALTGTEALRELVKYQGLVQRLHATFPQAVSDGPALTSMGPTSVSDKCYDGWRETMATLQQKGYLSSVRPTDHAIGFSTAEVTSKGKAFFDHLAAGSFYCTVRIVPDLKAANVQGGSIKLSAGGKRAQIEFRSRPTEPFRIMWENELFAAGCGGEVDTAVGIDQGDVTGHAHFRFQKGGWRIERVLLGEHRAEE
ncbi:MAG: hypothetical protein O2968_18530 [Acidobacteria bacterium]|nr:hypothetical protein [Acidobacteriota bacterium]